MDKHTHSNTETSCRAGQVRGCLGEPTGPLAGKASGKLKGPSAAKPVASLCSAFELV